MPLRLKALYADVVLPLHDTKVVLGRSRQCQITATTVSRHACTAVPNRDGSVQLTAGKAVYVQRKGSRAIYAVQREDTCVVCLECQQVLQANDCLTLVLTCITALQLNVGDTVYLGVVITTAEKPAYQYGLQLVGTAATQSQREGASQVLQPTCLPSLHADDACGQYITLLDLICLVSGAKFRKSQRSHSCN